MVANWPKLLQWTEMATNQILRLIESVPFLSLFSIPPTAAVQQCKKLVQRGKSHLCSQCALISRMHLPLPMPAFEVHTDGSVRFIYNGTQVSLPCTFDNVSLRVLPVLLILFDYVSVHRVTRSNASNRFTCCVLGGILVSVVRVCNAAVNDGKICSGASMQ